MGHFGGRLGQLGTQLWTSGAAEEKRGEFGGVISSICVISRAFRGILEHFQRFGVIPGDNLGRLKALL